MDFLQIALIFLILLLSIFLAITGFQVFFILRDLKKALDRLNKVLDIEQKGMEKGNHNEATGLIATLRRITKRRLKPRRFYKKTL